MPWLHLQATQADGLCLGLPVVMMPEQDIHKRGKNVVSNCPYLARHEMGLEGLVRLVDLRAVGTSKKLPHFELPKLIPSEAGFSRRLAACGFASGADGVVCGFNFDPGPSLGFFKMRV